MKKKCVSNWNQTLRHSQKLSFYYTIKKNYSTVLLASAYLDLTRKNLSRKALVNLRINSHKLRIETGRYDKIPLDDERLCSLCNCNRIEDETHFLQDCPSYSSFLRLLPHETLFSHLMNSTDYFYKHSINFFHLVMLYIERQTSYIRHKIQWNENFVDTMKTVH